MAPGVGEAQPPTDLGQVDAPGGVGMGFGDSRPNLETTAQLPGRRRADADARWVMRGTKFAALEDVLDGGA